MWNQVQKGVLCRYLIFHSIAMVWQGWYGARTAFSIFDARWHASLSSNECIACIRDMLWQDATPYMKTSVLNARISYRLLSILYGHLWLLLAASLGVRPWASNVLSLTTCIKSVNTNNGVLSHLVSCMARSDLESHCNARGYHLGKSQALVDGIQLEYVWLKANLIAEVWKAVTAQIMTEEGRTLWLD